MLTSSEVVISTGKRLTMIVVKGSSHKIRAVAVTSRELEIEHEKRHKKTPKTETTDTCNENASGRTTHTEIEAQHHDEPHRKKISNKWK